MLSIIMLSIIMLNVAFYLLSVIMLDVVMLSVVAPNVRAQNKRIGGKTWELRLKDSAQNGLYFKVTQQVPPHSQHSIFFVTYESVQ
jgi:hypothetical protein